MNRKTNPFIDLSDTDSLPELIDENEERERDRPVAPVRPNLGGFFGNLFSRKAKQSLSETYSHSIYESLTTLSSKILGANTGSGYLTREDFLVSGDLLVKMDSNWEWSFNQTKMLPDFPPDRQYLINRGLLCFKVKVNEERTHLDLQKNELWMIYNEIEANDNMATARHFYDLSITYDLSNATPRIWLFGYNQDGVPLDSSEIIEDMSVEFAGTIATMIPHPVSDILNVSIHPCRHAEVMSRLINVDDYDPSKYLILFLRLVNHIFPNLVLDVPKLH